MSYYFEDLFTSNLEGEIWKDVPGLEDLYQASSFGRIRSVDRYVSVNKPNQPLRLVKGKLLKQTRTANKNHELGDVTVYLRVNLRVDKSSYTVMARRIIYLTFEGTIDIFEDGNHIINIDGDGLNNHITNLKCVSMSVRNHLSIQRGRMKPFLQHTDTKPWNKSGRGSFPLRQMTFSGEIIAEYKSLTEAERKTGISRYEIAKGNKVSMNGFLWVFIQ